MLGADAAAEMLDGGILLVKWRGVVTLEAAEATKAAICAALPVEPLGVVSDYAGAAMAMTDDELLSIMVGGPHDLAELPAAVVVSELTFPAVFRASVAAAWCQRWRYVCQDRREAVGWVRSRQEAPAARRRFDHQLP